MDHDLVDVLEDPVARRLMGWVMWVGIAAVVAGWDIPAVRFGWEAGSAAFQRCPRSISWPATLYVAGHLMFGDRSWWPRRLDPLERVGALLASR